MPGTLAERERVGRHTRVEEGDLKRALAGRALPPDDQDGMPARHILKAANYVRMAVNRGLLPFV